MKFNYLKKNIGIVVMSTIALGSHGPTYAAPRLTVEDQKIANLAHKACDEIKAFICDCAKDGNSKKHLGEKHLKYLFNAAVEFQPQEEIGVKMKQMIIKSLKEFVQKMKCLKGSKKKLKELANYVTVELKKVQKNFIDLVEEIKNTPGKKLLVAELKKVSDDLKEFEERMNGKVKGGWFIVRAYRKAKQFVVNANTKLKFARMIKQGITITL